MNGDRLTEAHGKGKNQPLPGRLARTLGSAERENADPKNCALSVNYLVGLLAVSTPRICRGDAIHNTTASLNLYLQNHAAVTNTLLIVSSMIIDFLAVFILCFWILRAGLASMFFMHLGTEKRTFLPVCRQLYGFSPADAQTISFSQADHAPDSDPTW